MRLKQFDAEIRLLAISGAHVGQVTEQIGCSYAAIHNYAKKHGIEFTRKRDPKSVERTELMRAMYVQGITYQAIGEKFGVSRQCVQQKLEKLGVDCTKGGQRFSARVRRETKMAATMRRIEAEWGVSYSEWKAYRADKTIAAFEQHRTKAARRCIPFSLTFPQWLAIWQASGKLRLKGRGKGHYCMSRLSYSGGYEIGNVHIQSCIENSRDAVKVWQGKPPKEYPGVFCLYPGTKNPWRAGSQGKHAGFYPTQQEAASALAALRTAKA